MGHRKGKLSSLKHQATHTQIPMQRYSSAHTTGRWKTGRAGDGGSEVVINRLSHKRLHTRALAVICRSHCCCWLCMHLVPCACVTLTIKNDYVEVEAPGCKGPLNLQPEEHLVYAAWCNVSRGAMRWRLRACDDNSAAPRLLHGCMVAPAHAAAAGLPTAPVRLHLWLAWKWGRQPMGTPGAGRSPKSAGSPQRC